MVPSQTLTIGAYYLNRRGEVMGPILKNETPNQPENSFKYPFKVDDHRLGEMTYTAKGKHVFGSAGLDDLIVDSEGAIQRVIHTGECYHTKTGNVVGPIFRTKGGDQAAGAFPFYYELPGYGKVYLTTEGAARNSHSSRNLDLARQGSGPDLPEPTTTEWAPMKANKSKTGGFKILDHHIDEIFGKSSHKPKPPKPKPKPKEVKMPAPRRRVININPVKNIVAAEPEGPKWKRLSVYEDKYVVLPLADVQHIDKLRTFKNQIEEPDGLRIVTSKTKRVPGAPFDSYENACLIPESEAADFLKQFDAYLTFLETPVVITKEKPKKKGKDIGKASGVIFESINALIPEDGSFFDEDDEDMPF